MGRMKSMVGTLSYCAPEVLKGDYSEKCDVWSVGVVSFLCCTGHLPIYHEREDRLVQEIMNANINWGSMIAGVDDNLREIIMTMLVEEDKRLSASTFAENAWLEKTATKPAPACCEIS